ncbi:MAG: hypothetical protein ACIWVG_16245 [Gloeotrichia echinulata HAB0833]
MQKLYFALSSLTVHGSSQNLRATVKLYRSSGSFQEPMTYDLNGENPDDLRSYSSESYNVIKQKQS